MKSIAAALLPTLGLAVLVVAVQPPAPDLILTNGKIFTSDPARAWADAVAIRGDRIAAVGTSADVARSAGAATRTIDAGGHTVIPGINDAHAHPGVRPPSVQLKLPGDDPSWDEVVTVVRDAAARNSDDRWLIGEVSVRVLDDPRATRFALDQGAPGRKIKLYAWTGHGQIFSTAALRAVGVDDREPDPPGGRYGRRADGAVDGRFEEYADMRANRRLTELANDEDTIAALRRMSDEAVRYGITSIQAMGNAIRAERLVPLLERSGTPLRWRAIRFPLIDPVGPPGGSELAPLPRRPGARIGGSGVKWILDGTPVERLAATNAPYADRPGWSGRVNFSPSQIDAMMRRALDDGDQIMLHATGDRAVDAVMTSMEKLAPASRWQRLRVRIEHGDMLEGPRIARARALGMVLVQNPAHFTLTEVMRARYGDERSRTLQPLKSVLAAGVPLAIGSDGPMNPYLNMMFAVTHPDNPSEALTREQAIAAYTAGAAYAEFAERDKGRIAPGYLADLAVLSQDIFTVAVPRLPETHATMTIVGGRVVYQEY